MQFAMHATQAGGPRRCGNGSVLSGAWIELVSRNQGGEGDVHQEQSWLSNTGAMDSHLLILTRFVELPEARHTVYPGEIWLCFQVPDVDAEHCRALRPMAAPAAVRARTAPSIRSARRWSAIRKGT